MIRLQLALDGPLQGSLDLLGQVHEYIDIIEVGTPLIIMEGLGAVRAVRHAFLEIPILADLKIMDAGEVEANLAFEAGCSWVTMLGLASDATARGVVAAARCFEGKVMADLMQVPNLAARGEELLALGCDMLCVHTAYDLQESGQAPLSSLAALRSALPEAPLAVAGGIGPEAIEEVTRYDPRIVVVGGAITRAQKPVRNARLLKGGFENHE